MNWYEIEIQNETNRARWIIYDERWNISIRNVEESQVVQSEENRQALVFNKMFLYRSLQKFLPFLFGVFFGIFLFNSYHISSEDAKEVRFTQQNIIAEGKIKDESKIHENEIKVATEHRERVQNVAVNVVPNILSKKKNQTKVFKDIYSFDENEKDFGGKYWEMAPHYNVDDYGEQIILSDHGCDETLRIILIHSFYKNFIRIIKSIFLTIKA